MIKSIIVAKSSNNVIGKENHLIWHFPNDLRFFKNKTFGHYLIVGRKTFESIKIPLKGRKIIIVTNNRQYQEPKHSVVHNLNDALYIAQKAGETEVFITGGAQIYSATLGITDKIYLTEIKGNFKGDTFFPPLQYNHWLEIKRKCNVADGAALL